MSLSLIGYVHLAASLLALGLGTLVLYLPKRTRRHTLLGYGYFAAMVILLGTAFMIYNLYGRFGLFHIMALISSATLLGGIVPMWIRWPAKNYFHYHVAFMYWSVIGLYAAFFAEVLTRLPFLIGVEKDILFYFYGLVAVATGGTCWVGSRYFRRYLDSWLQAAPEGS